MSRSTPQDYNKIKLNDLPGLNSIFSTMRNSGLDYDEGVYQGVTKLFPQYRTPSTQIYRLRDAMAPNLANLAEDRHL